MSAASLWAESYQGEVLGEVLFGTLAGLQTDPARREQLELLTLLERATKELAEPMLDRHGYPRGDTAATAEAAAQLARGSADVPWEQFIGSFEPVTSQFLAKYRELVQLAGDDDERSVAEAYVAHERALAAWARRTLGQEEGEPAEPILALPHVAAAAARA
jgi:hypothetical protein